MDTTIDTVLDERAERYGRFADLAVLAQRLKLAMHAHADAVGTNLDDDMTEALDMIASKVARICNGDPAHIDHWVDIAGYAMLVAERLQGRTR